MFLTPYIRENVGCYLTVIDGFLVRQALIRWNANDRTVLYQLFL